MTRTASRPSGRYQDQLVGLLIAPTIWAVHFLVCYVFAAIWCAKHFGITDLTVPRVVVGVATLAALAGIGLVSLRVVNQWGFTVGEEPRHDSDTPDARHAFLTRATFLLCGLSAVSTIYVAVPAIFLSTCR